MISFNSPINSQQSSKGILISQRITEKATADVTGYNIQYLRRMLRSGDLKDIKIGQMWLIEMGAQEEYLKHVETTSDRRYGSIWFYDLTAFFRTEI